MSLYRNILKQAWGLSWSHKYLWFFGLFAAMIGTGEYEIVSQSMSGMPNFGIIDTLNRYAQTNVFSGQTAATLKAFMLNDPASFVLFVAMTLLLLFVTIFILWLTIVSQGSLVHNATQIYLKKNHDFKAGLEVGMNNFWTLAGLNVIIKFVIYFCLILMSIPVALSFKHVGLVGLNFIYLFSFLIFIPIAVVLTFIIKYAMAYRIIKGDEFYTALRRGWNLFLDNWLVSLEMAFILFFITFVAGFSILIILLALAIPFLFLSLLVYYTISAAASSLVFALALIIGIFVVAAFGSLITVFQISAWTGLFLELTGKGGVSKLVRLFDGWTK
ncbi:hypothetical protein HGA34_05610 [Candidatus Falkowbacteria bacterium]|nr:hypothetical protein [Candidatus Falkowbacteria bacterium]